LVVDWRTLANSYHHAPCAEVFSEGEPDLVPVGHWLAPEAVRGWKRGSLRFRGENGAGQGDRRLARSLRSAAAA